MYAMPGSIIASILNYIRNSGGTSRKRAMSNILSLILNPEGHNTSHVLHVEHGKDGTCDSVLLAYAKFLYPYAYM